MPGNVMKYAFFAIFALLIACDEPPEPIILISLKFSDALPIQFWPTGCATYNESEPDGVSKKCYCHKINCSDLIHIQAIDDQISDPTMQGLPSYVNHFGSGNQWAAGLTRTVTCGSFQSSDFLKGNLTDWPVLIVGGNVVFNYEVNIGSTPGFQMTVYLTDNTFDFDHAIAQSLPLTLSGPGFMSGTINVPVSAVYGNAQPFYIGIAVNNLGSGSRTFTLSLLTLNSITPDSGSLEGKILDEDDNVLATIPFSKETFIHSGHSELEDFSVFDASFHFSDFDLCDQKTRVVLYQAGEEVATSDCLDLAESWPNTILLDYSNARNYAGIINNSGGGTPEGVIYHLRIPAIFYKGRFPETVQVEPLSNNRYISLNSQVEKQKLLKTDYLPDFMHLKIMLAIKHQFLTINEVDYVQKENYEQQDTKEGNTVSIAQCYLTEKEYIVRNVL